MAKSRLELVIESIDANLHYLHKQRWAGRAGLLRRQVDTSQGEEKDRAKQALRDHYGTEHKPELTREALVREAIERDASMNAAK